MADENKDVFEFARSVSRRLAGGALTPGCAKLYSQHTRLDAGQPGLRTWRSTEAASRLDEAVRLIEASLIQKNAGDANWFEAMLRAAELLEWLAHPTLNQNNLPISMLAAAAYQLAGYPARAAGLLSLTSESSAQIGPLSFLLSGNFPRLLRSLTTHWELNPKGAQGLQDVDWTDGISSATGLRELVESETASALGILCAAMRWGENDRVDAAMAKLTAVSKFMLNGHDTYSWLLAKLVAETCKTFVESSLRRALVWLPAQLDGAGGLAVERYLRQAYQGCKTQAWPSQRRGIERLKGGDSFVLCTPTGSGKTTVAEIAILQRLFSAAEEKSAIEIAPLVMYLVPKRALAAEVEAKLLKTIAPLCNDRVVITGLYGGIDWGPTDAWLTSDERTVLICTYEKAEALIRFLGPLFLGRLSLVVFDEAHMVQFDGRDQELRTSESRSLRLESLISRLFVHVPANQSRVIALSAVAAGMENTLAKWITGNEAATPAKTLYRSTRQLIGRLQCKTRRGFDIRYDLLDRASLRFAETGEGGTPFVPDPFPPFPPAPAFERAGPEKRLRPYLFWAAMHMVSPAKASRRHSVLVSVPQRIGGYAQDLLDLLEKAWADAEVPKVFDAPTDPEKFDKWQRCLRACEDYFGRSSREYRLLEKGIVAHHGKMPGLMARLLIQLIDERVVHLILATSTLSEGVNLPFEVVLLPTLRRGADWISPREFANLAGRAGRPGYGTEGRCLVVLPAEPQDWSGKQLLNKYEELIERLKVAPERRDSGTGGRSALAALLTSLRAQWQFVSNSNNEAEFLKWLEITATLRSARETSEAANNLVETLDSLDSILLSAVVEIESLAGAPLTNTELEGRLTEIWERCYAHYASENEAILGKWFLLRGQALTTRIYPEAEQRRGLYRSGLPPRLGGELMQLYPTVRQHLLSGADYAERNADGQFEFIKDLVIILTTHSKFALDVKTPGKTPWEEMLRWWLDPRGPITVPTATKVSDWYDYVAKNFSYRFCWGVGCILALAANQAHGDTLQPTTLDGWGETGLPWIALWLKELVVWGTLDPVAAFLLGRGIAGTRSEAADVASRFFADNQTIESNEKLNPVTIRKWTHSVSRTPVSKSRTTPESPLKVTLERTIPKRAARRWRVLPTEVGKNIRWIDPAGFALAVGDLPSGWDSAFLEDGDFFLDIDSRTVSYEPFL